MNIKCPNCGAGHYQFYNAIRTLMYYPPIYKDGVNTNPDMNTTTNYCGCIECGHDFYYKERGGEVIEIVDQGKKPEVPVIKTPINAPEPKKNITFKADNLFIKQDPPSTSIRIVTEKDMNEVRQAIKELTEEVKELKGIIYADNRVAKKKVVSASVGSFVSR